MNSRLFRLFVPLLTCFFLLGNGWSDGLYGQPESDPAYIHLQFYSAKLSLPAAPGTVWPSTEAPDELLFRAAYAHYEAQDLAPLLKKVGDYRRGMTLSDWHYYNVIADYGEAAFPEANRNALVMFQWYMLRKAGLDVRLFHTETDIYLHGLTEDIQFGFYIIEQSGQRFANLTARRAKLQLDTVEAYMPIYRPDEASLPLVMKFNHLPMLPNPTTIERLISFRHRGEAYELRVFLNNDHLEIMDDYPYFSQAAYFNIGLSSEAEHSLLPQLELLMEGKTASEQIELLLSFTRTAFFYKDDRRRYGKEKPMTPEQTLYHSYSDCEDRSALFFYLCRKLLGLPVIVLDFETHVGTAVELPGVIGNTFEHKGRKFVYCEPTGPQDILQIGEMWDDIKKQKARVLTEYIPQ